LAVAFWIIQSINPFIKEVNRLPLGLAGDQLELLESAQTIIAGLLCEAGGSETLVIAPCDCSNTCVDACTGCQTCQDTSKA